MTIVPDTKDWTWVLQRPCPECGLNTSTFTRESIPLMVRGNPDRLADTAGRPRRGPAFPGRQEW